MITRQLVKRNSFYVILWRINVIAEFNYTGSYTACYFINLFFNLLPLAFYYYIKFIIKVFAVEKIFIISAIWEYYYNKL